MDYNHKDPVYPSGLDENSETDKFLKDNLDLLYKLIGHFSATSGEYDRIREALKQNRKALGLPF